MPDTLGDRRQLARIVRIHDARDGTDQHQQDGQKDR
jgi:hypothetical protein